MMAKMLVMALMTAKVAAQDNPIPRTTTVTVQGIKVELKRCEKVSTKSISCSLIVTNLQADRVIRLGGNYSPICYYVDAGGMQIKANGSQIGSSIGSSYSETEVVTDTPVRGSVEFGVGDPHATSRPSSR